MTETEQALLDKAWRALEAAEANLARDDAETAINRAYYASFYAALAALDAVGERPKTHRRALRRFYLRVVQSGQISRDVGEILSHALDFRQQVDYDTFSLFEVQAATDLTADARRFVETIAALLSR